MNGDAPGPADFKGAWERVEKVWGGVGGIKCHSFSTSCLTEKLCNNKGPVPACPISTSADRLRQRPCVAGACVHPMSPGSVILSSVESGDHVAHMDTSNPPPPVLPPSDRSKLDCHLSTFVALSPRYRLRIEAGTALGEAQVERWDEVLLKQGEVFIMVSTARHHGPPPRP